jgi:hypothetical protein
MSEDLGPLFDCLFDEIAKDADPQLVERIKERMKNVMRQYLPFPRIDITLVLKGEITTEALRERIETQVRAAIVPYCTELLRDLAFAEARLCQFEASRPRRL